MCSKSTCTGFGGFTDTTEAMAGLFQNDPDVNIALIRGAQILLGVFLAAIVSLQLHWKRESHQDVPTPSRLPNQQMRRLARQHAGRVVLALFGTLFAWLWLDIPGGPFAMAAASVIATPAIDSAMIRFSQKLAGILIGTSLAIVFTALFLPGMKRIQEFELCIFGRFSPSTFLNYLSQNTTSLTLMPHPTLPIVLVRAAHQSSDLLAIWQRGRAIAIGLIVSFLVIAVLTKKTMRRRESPSFF